MSKSISVIFVILILIVAGIAYLNYDRLNQIQSELLEKEALLEDSEQLVRQQGASIAQLEEQIKETIEIEKEELSPDKSLIQEREEEFIRQLAGYQEELQELRKKLEETVQHSRIESQELTQLEKEKSKLEALLEEKETQWQSREKENQETIASLREEMQKYDSDIKTVNEKISDLEKYLNSETTIRKDLEQEMTQHEEDITILRGKLALAQDDETKVQQISQLQVNKKQLEEEIEQKDSILDQIQKEYQSLQTQLVDYEQKMTVLQEEVVMIEEQKDVLGEIQDSLAQLNEEKSKLEILLHEKEAQWLAREEENQETISSLQEEVQKYESNLREIGHEILSLREDLIQEMTFKETLQKEIEHFTTEIEPLKEEVAYFREIEQSFQDTFYQLQSDKELLEKQLEEKGLEIEEHEYQELLNQLSLYRDQMDELKKELTLAREKEDAILTAQLIKIQQERESLERILAEKEDEWSKQNQENRELILYLKDQVEKYQKEIKEVKIDSSLLREEIAAQVELQQERDARITDREEQILELTSKIEGYAQKIQDYEISVNQLRTKLNQQENLTIEEQQELMDDLVFWMEEIDAIQNSINQCYTQVSILQAEITELKNKIAFLEKEEESQYYEVKSGDCLWTIAKERYNEGIAWTKIFNANRELIENPDLIYPYQQIIVPE